MRIFYLKNSKLPDLEMHATLHGQEHSSDGEIVNLFTNKCAIN